jgi:hypothetical protein
MNVKFSGMEFGWIPAMFLTGSSIKVIVVCHHIQNNKGHHNLQHYYG